MYFKWLISSNLAHYIVYSKKVKFPIRHLKEVGVGRQNLSKNDRKFSRNILLSLCTHNRCKQTSPWCCHKGFYGSTSCERTDLPCHGPSAPKRAWPKAVTVYDTGCLFAYCALHSKNFPEGDSQGLSFTLVWPNPDVLGVPPLANKNPGNPLAGVFQGASFMCWGADGSATSVSADQLDQLCWDKKKESVFALKGVWKVDASNPMAGTWQRPQQ